MTTTMTVLNLNNDNDNDGVEFQPNEYCVPLRLKGRLYGDEEGGTVPACATFLIVMNRSVG